MKKYQACKELKHRVCILARTAKRVPNRANSKDADQTYFCQTQFFFTVVRFYFYKKLTVWFLIRTQHTRPPSAVRPVLLWLDHSFGQKYFFAGPLFCRICFLVGSFRIFYAMIKVCLLFDNLSVHNSMLRLPQGPYLDPHCTFFSKIKSADICKDWVRGLTKNSDQRRFSLQVKQYNTGI